MYDLRDYKPPEKLYGEVKCGWHSYGRIERADLKKRTAKSGKDYQYWLLDFDVEGVLVPFYAFHNEGQKTPDAAFGKLFMIAELLDQDFSGDPGRLARALIGLEFRVKVAKGFKKGTNRQVRTYTVVDFEPVPDSYEPEE